MIIPDFKIFAILIIFLWVIALLIATKIKHRNSSVYANSLFISGFLLFAVYLILYWIRIERPPFKTIAETRLWYSFLLIFTGLLINFIWRLKWFLNYCVLVSIIFMLINILKPSLSEKTLMPALQSPWFIPHVVIYMQAYALLGGAFLCSVRFYYFFKSSEEQISLIKISDKLIYLGFSFLTIGMIFGALWAKKAWGDYWAWDPKETWALISWLSYLVYIHLRNNKPKNYNLAAGFIIFSFITILICWLGMKFIPYAQTSIHFY